MNTIPAMRSFVSLVLAGALALGGPQGKGEEAAAKALTASYQLQAIADYGGAIQLMRPLVDASPKAYFLRLRLAYLFLQKGEYQNSADSYRAAAQLEPAAVEPLLGQQQALMALERYDDAEKVGRELLQRDPRNYLGLSRQAWIQFKRESYAASADLYQQVLALYPGDVEMLSGLGYAQVWLGKKSTAEATFRKVLANVPGHLSATTGLTYCK